MIKFLLISVYLINKRFQREPLFSFFHILPYLKPICNFLCMFIKLYYSFSFFLSDTRLLCFWLDFVIIEPVD